MNEVDLAWKQSHFGYKNKTGTAGIIEATLFHEVLGSSQRIQYDHRAAKDVKVYNVAYLRAYEGGLQ